MRVLSSAAKTTEPATRRCLWISREIPFPANSGDRIYSGRLVRAVAEAGLDITYIGLLTGDPAAVPPAPGPTWIGVPGARASYWLAFFSRFPLVAAAYGSRGLREVLRQFLRQDWDVIVLDHYSSAWALDRVKRYVRTSQHDVVLAHIAQNHEEDLALSLYRSYAGSWPKRIVLYLNYLKIRHWERRLASEVDVVGTITPEDCEKFSRQSSHPELIVLTPGHSGYTATKRTLTQSVPRRVVLVGTYHWVVKQENLRQLLASADGPFADHGIVLDVVGDVPSQLLEEFEGKMRATVFHGFVADFQPFCENSRLALVPEVIGGGFKLKFLDYIFGRIPVAAITSASAGLPDDIRCHLLLSDSLPRLVDQVVTHIDDLEHLNVMQAGAFDAASTHFNWADRGVSLYQAILRRSTRVP